MAGCVNCGSPVTTGDIITHGGYCPKCYREVRERLDKKYAMGGRR